MLYLINIWIWLRNANFWKSDYRMIECASIWFLKILFWVIIHIKFGRLNQLNSILECPECKLIEIWWQLHSKRSNISLRWEHWHVRFWFLKFDSLIVVNVMFDRNWIGFGFVTLKTTIAWGRLIWTSWIAKFFLRN